MAKNEVATQDQSAQVPVGVEDFEQFAGAGMEHVTSDDILVPRLGILQSLSPQLSKKRAEYINGAEEGQIADLGLGEVFPDGVLFLPVHFSKSWLEWAPRSSGGGLVNVHTKPGILDHCRRNAKNQPELENGNSIVETAQFFGLNLTANRRKCFIPMTSTQLKKARRWNTLASSEKLKRSDGSEFTAPLWYRGYELTTADESNSQGEWAGWVINRGPTLPEIDIGTDWHNIKEEAIEFRNALVKGEVRGDVASMDEGSSNSSAASDEEVQF